MVDDAKSIQVDRIDFSYCNFKKPQYFWSPIPSAVINEDYQQLESELIVGSTSSTSDEPSPAKRWQIISENNDEFEVNSSTETPLMNTFESCSSSPLGNSKKPNSQNLTKEKSYSSDSSSQDVRSAFVDQENSKDSLISSQEKNNGLFSPNYYIKDYQNIAIKLKKSVSTQTETVKQRLLSPLLGYSTPSEVKIKKPQVPHSINNSNVICEDDSLSIRLRAVLRSTNAQSNTAVKEKLSKNKATCYKLIETPSKSIFGSRDLINELDKSFHSNYSDLVNSPSGIRNSQNQQCDGKCQGKYANLASSTESIASSPSSDCYNYGFFDYSIFTISGTMKDSNEGKYSFKSFSTAHY